MLLTKRLGWLVCAVALTLAGASVSAAAPGADPKPTDRIPVDPIERIKGDALERIEQAHSKISLRAEQEELGSYYDATTQRLVVVAAEGHSPESVRIRLGAGSEVEVIQSSVARSTIELYRNCARIAVCRTRVGCIVWNDQQMVARQSSI